jgi:BirA family biotin operon repressor/biotin-[acetyl-CoA-carboxylase] ligase
MCQYIGKTIVKVDRTESTNNYAIGQVYENEVEEGTVFLAHDQTAGRGHFANKWESEAGKNLTFSIFIQPAFLPVYQTFMLSKVVCLGIENCLSKFIDDVKIKWPNDIYVNDRKACGILIENGIMNSQIRQSVIGVGLNVNQARFYSDASNPVSLKLISGETYDLDALLKEVLQSIDYYYAQLVAGKFEYLDQEFHDRLYRFDEWHAFKDENHHYTGKITGVNEIGQLRIQEKDGPMHEYHFKEVVYL